MKPEEIYRGATTRHWREGDSRCCLIDRPLVIELAQQALAAVPGSVVDLGCGTGRWTIQLAPHAEHVVGIDHSPDMLAIARDHEASNVTYQGEDIFSLVQLVGLNSQALVMTLMTLQHLENSVQLAELFAQVEHVLVPGGTFLMLVPHPVSYVSGRSKWIQTVLPDDFNPNRTSWITSSLRNTTGEWTTLSFWYHPESVYRAALAAAGLKVVQTFSPVPGPEHLPLHPDLVNEDVPLGWIVQAKRST